MRKIFIFILLLISTLLFSFDPPTNVVVDDEIGTIFWLAPVTTIIESNFDDYDVGDYITVVDDNWTTWSNQPGGAEDALVTDAQASSPSNSVIVEENDDLILIMDDYSTDKYSFDIKMYVPTGYCGYFNLQKTSTPGEELAFQIYFQTNGDAVADAGAIASCFHTFNHDEWMDIKLIIDLDNNWATYHFNGIEMIGYQWTLGTFGIPGLLSFGGVNIKGVPNSTQPTDIPMFYMDDVVLGELQDVTGFCVYLDNTFINTVCEDVTEYMYEGLNGGQTYLAGVSALYDGGESEIVTVEFTYPGVYFLPPNSVAAVVIDYNDVELTWNAPGGTAERIQWDSGENSGNAIGLTNGGTFYVASHWYPEYLVDYDGATIFKIEFFPNDIGDFVISIWTGPNAETLVTTEVVTSPTVGLFQEVVLSSPFTIDASTELWFGYEVTHNTGVLPAGCDDGPAVQELGDMISLDGTSWTGMSAAYNLDYNWNLAAYVEGSDGEVTVLNKPCMVIESNEKSVSNNSMMECNPFSCVPTLQVRNTRSLSGFKVFRDGTEIAEITFPGPAEFVDTALDVGTYEYTVTALYTNPPGESCHTDPVSATIVLNPPVSLTACSIPPNVLLNWEPPNRGIDSYNVYRDGVLLEEGITGLMYIDIAVPVGTYCYNVTALYDGDYESEFSNDAEWVQETNPILLPLITALNDNYPNPFNPTTTISFSTKEAGHVAINIYNMKGQLVKSLVNENLDAAYHNVVWDGKDNRNKTASSGIYFYKMKSSNYTSTKKMILMK